MRGSAPVAGTTNASARQTADMDDTDDAVVLDAAVDPDAAAERVRTFLADYLEESGAAGYVLGVSGGLDSAVAARLAVDAVGADRVVGQVLPGEPSDEANMRDARDLCEDLGIDYTETSITPLVRAVREGLSVDLETVDVGNLRARARMVYLYTEANARDLLVIGPDNRSELLLGYFTKYGDGAADVAPLADLYKTEVYDLARAIDLPERFVEKTPTAELWEGQTDEGELGADYATIDPILRVAVDEGRSAEATADATGEDVELVRRFVEMYERSRHKRERPPSPGRPE